MLEIDNINHLRNNFTHIWNKIDFSSGVFDGLQLETVQATNGLPTLVAKVAGRVIAVHSKYDPVQEAELIINQYPIHEYDHVFFYGLGMGYHIEEFIKKYPEKTFTIYEPCMKILELYLKNKDSKKIFNKNLYRFYIEKSPKDRTNNLSEFIQEKTVKKVLLLFLPSYKRVFQKQFENFTALFKQIVIDRKSTIKTNLAFEKRWIINSLVNLPATLSTPNVLHDLDKELFKDKPALIVAAGPSLEEDLEHIRYIKNHGIAYIFSVGSAINVLINNGIYPHAACTYDPREANQRVFELIKERGIKEIPMLFGTSVGFETLFNYPGKKAHFVTSQDTITPFLLDNTYNGMRLDKVNDAASIAVITVQLLAKLGFNPIIFAGQNLAFKDNKRYAQGIAYIDPKNSIKENDIKSAIEIEDVLGEKILTSKSLNTMRKQLEQYISAYKKKNPKQIFINTTKGGAKIEGSIFKPIEELIEELDKTNIICDNWIEIENQYDKDLINEKINILKEELNSFGELINELQDKINEFDEKEDETKYKILPIVYNLLLSIKENLIFTKLIEPMNRVELEIITKEINESQFIEDIYLKTEVIITNLKKFFVLNFADYKNIVLPAFNNMVNDIYKIIEASTE